MPGGALLASCAFIVVLVGAVPGERRTVDETVCAEALDEGAGTPPPWPESDLHDHEVREEIVRLATEIALDKLWWTHADTNFHKKFDSPDHTGPGAVHECVFGAALYTQASREQSVRALQQMRQQVGDQGYKRALHGEYERKHLRLGRAFVNPRRTVSLQVSYTRVNREADVYARLEKEIVKIKEPAGDLETDVIKVDSGNTYWDDQVYGADKSTRVSRYREEISAHIEVFPEVFARRAMWIAEEDRWAASATESVVYILLHEFGHLEAFLAKHSEHNYVHPMSTYPSFRLREAGDSEADAWSFASSAVRADR